MNQHEIYAANRADDDAVAEPVIRKMLASTALIMNDTHHVIADDWLRRAISGIREMCLDDDERWRISKDLLAQLALMQQRRAQRGRC